MLLNRIEFVMMNNPIRAAIQRYFEARRLLSMGGRMAGGAALEVGCGRGVGTELILDIFGAERVDAFDLDPDMIDLARRRLSTRGRKVRLWTGDVSAIPAEDNSYEAAFDFGVIHHVQNWRDGLVEIHRVLKPRGRLYGEEVFENVIDHPIWRRLLKHPQQDRFDLYRFCEALESLGFRIVATSRIWKWFGWVVAEKQD